MRKKVTGVLSAGLALTMILSMVAYGNKRPADGISAATSPSNNIAAVAGTGADKVTEVTNKIISIKDTPAWDSRAGASGVFYPAFQCSNYDRGVVFLAYNRLLTKGVDGSYIENLHESREINEDATAYTFNLKRGIKWHDGEVFAAGDVAFTYKATCHFNFGKGHDEFFTVLPGIDAYHDGITDHAEGTKVTDNYTISPTFKVPYLDALVKSTDKLVLVKHIWGGTPVGKWGDAIESLQNPVGIGPYKFVGFVPGQYVKLVANLDYFKGKSLIGSFISKTPNKDTCQVELINGSVDVIEIRTWCPDGAQTFLDNNIPIAEQLNTNATYPMFDTIGPILSDVRTRQAIIYAVNRQIVMDRLVASYGSLSNALMKLSLSMHPGTLNTYDYSTEKAQELLRETGYEGTNSDGVVDKGDEDPTLALQYSTGGDDELVQVIRNFAKAAGIQADLVDQSFNTVPVTPKNSAAEFGMAITGAIHRVNMGYSGSNFWMSRWDKNPKEIELLNVAAASKNTEEAAANHGTQCEYDNEVTPQFVLYFYNQGYAYNPKLTNYVVAPDEWLYNVET